MYAQLKVLILSAGTGGGHESVAIALSEALQVHAGTATQTTIATPLGSAVDRCYNWLLNRAPQLWGACYHLTDRATAGTLGARTLQIIRRSALDSLIAVEQPDLILSVHALCAQAVAGRLRRLGISIPHYCVITDLLDVHRTWFAPGVAMYYVASQQAYRAARRAGITPDHVLLTGLPIRLPFWSAALPTAARAPERDEARLRVLLMDGGRPGPALARTLATLLRAGPALDIAVAWGSSPRPSRVPIPQEFSNCIVHHLAPGAVVAPYMRAADLVVTKAGSVTIAEALALGRPLLLHRAAPGQEASNPGLIEAAGAGLYTPSRPALAAALRGLATNPRERQAMAARAAALGRPDAACRIAGHLCAALGVGAVTQADLAG